METNVHFYEKINELQNVQHDCESRRIALEKQLYSHMKSDKRAARLKAIRLKSYWNKICEDEKRSQTRNEQLLKDFERAEAHLQELHARTEKLQEAKKRYEEHVERVYPNWKEKIMHFERIQKHQEEQDKAEELRRLQQQYRPPTYAATNQHTSTHRSDDVSPHAVTRNTGDIIDTQPVPSGEQHGQVVQHPGPSGEQQGQAQHHREHESPVSRRSQPSDNKHESRSSDHHKRQSSFDYLSPREPTSSPQSAKAAAHATPQRSAHSTPNLNSSHVSDHDVRTFMSEAEKEIQKREKQFRGLQHQSPKSVHDDVKRTPVADRQKYSPGRLVAVDQDHTDDQNVSDIASDEAVPFSARDLAATPRRVVASRESPRDAAGAQPSQHSNREASGRSQEHDNSVSESRQVTQVKPQHVGNAQGDNNEDAVLEGYLHKNGLYNIFSAIEADLERAGHSMKLYDCDKPAQSVINDIIATANKDEPLTYNPSDSLSMVVLDQLAFLLYDTPDQCLWRDQVLRKPPHVVSETSIRSLIDSSMHELWTKLHNHWLVLLKFRVLTPASTAQIFAPHLINEESPYESKAEHLLQVLLENAWTDDLHSPQSTDTLVTPRVELRKKEVKQDSVEVNDEDFFDHAPAPVANTLVTSQLTQSDGYRRLLTSTQSTVKSHLSYIDSDENDDVEEILDLSPQKPSAAPPSRSGSVVKIPAANDGTAAGALRDGAVSPESLLSAASLPPSTSMTSPKQPGLAKAMSTLSDTGKSGRSSISLGSPKKSKAFYQDSDTDEDISFAAGEADNNKDEFDFYD